MDKTRNNTQNGEKGVTRSAFWGTIVLSGITLLVYAYFFTFLLQQSKTPVVYIALGVFLFSFVSAVTSIVLTIFHRQDLGVKLVFYTLFIMGLTITSVFQERARTASLSILVISIVEIVWLLPSQFRRWYSAITGVAILAMWTIEWVNPPWRVKIAAATIGPAAVILFGIIFGVLAFIQTREAIANRFLSLSLRAKLLTSIIGITGLALLVYGTIFLYRTQQSQTFWSTELQDNVQQQSQQQIGDSAQFEAHTADQTLTEITLAVKQLADYQATLFTQKSLLGEGGYWNGKSKLTQRADGKYVNATSDPASVFIPNTTTLSPELIADLNISMYLDFSAPAVLKQNPNIVAVYYVGADNYTVYYPNIDLASAVPADFDARSQSFYTVAVPENDPERKPAWTEPYQDPAGKGLIVTTSVPVYDQNDQFRGVMSADVQLSKISEQISTIKVGETGFAFLIDPSGHIVAMPDAGYQVFGAAPEIVPVGESPKTTVLGLGSSDLQNVTQKMVDGESGLATVTIQDTQYYVSYAPLPVIGYSIGLIAPTAELDAAYLAAREKIVQETQVTTNLSILILLVVLLAAGGVSLLLGQFLSKPLTQLTETATEVAKGNLNIQAEVRTNDEIGILASTFNTMTSRLRDILGSLEQRVADRTRNLELAAEVGRAVSEVRDLDVMLKDACDLILKEFGLYYVQVYLTDPIRATLKLEAGTGNVGEQLVGRGHSLPLDISSINGRAAMEKHTVVISDTTQSTTFRQNPLLPDTRGEMAVPLIVANNVVGVLDMQSREPGVLKEEVLPAFEALAGQLAVAIQNANLLAETKQARAEVEKQAARLVRTSWREHLDAIHKPEQIGFMFNQKVVVPLTEANEAPVHESDKTMSAPIAITGETLGSLVVEMDDASRTEQTATLINVVAHQVAQQIENLRLLESAERYRYEAEQAVRQQTRENWQSYFQSERDNTLSYLYDLNEVRPHNNGYETNENVYTLPLQVRDEAIGKLAIQGLGSDDHESIDLINAVADRLTTHIEGLRQSDQTQSALAQSEMLFDASRNLTQATDLQQLVSTAVSTLKIPEINRAILVAFNYNESDSIESLDVVANWWNGTGQQATAIGTHYPLEVIRVMQMFVSPTPVFFDNTFTDKRVDAATMQLVQRLTLRAVAVLPLHVSTGQIGALILEAEVPHHFTSEETRLFTAIAPQIATIMDNRRQFEETKRGQVELDKRARQLAAVAEVSSVSSRELDIQKMLETVVFLTQRKFGLYHAHVFLYNEKADELKIAACGWQEGDEHEGTHGTTSIPLTQEQSLVARAARTQKAVIVNDVRNEPGWLPNPLLPDTASELAVPLLIGDRVLGVLDVQSDRLNAFTEEDANIQTTLASQVATALQNARSFSQAQKQAEREAMLNVINQKIQSATSVEAVLQIAARELGHALGAPMTIAQLSMKDKSS